MKMLFEMLGLSQYTSLIEIAEIAWRVALILVLAWVVSRVLRRLIGLLRARAALHSDDPEEAKRIETLAQVFGYVASVVIGLVAFMLILGILGISIAPILATAGVAGLAIGFGAQSLVKDYFTGFVLLLENQLRKGDVVDLGIKSGVVEQVTLRYVRLRDYSGNVHFVPNGMITAVTNMTREFAFAVIEVGIAYRSDIDRAFEVARETAAAFRTDPVFGPKVLADLEIAGVENWADSAVMLRMRFRTMPIEQWNVRREFLRRLKYAFDAAGIEIPYPHLTVYSGEAKDRAAFRIEDARSR